MAILMTGRPARIKAKDFTYRGRDLDSSFCPLDAPDVMPAGSTIGDQWFQLQRRWVRPGAFKFEQCESHNAGNEVRREASVPLD